MDTMIRHLITLPSTNQKIFCITGMGGCGKTQLVSYFLQEKGAQYPHTVFVDASSASSLKADLQAWARSRGIGHERDVWEDAIRMLASGPYAGQWVLVLDNADNPKLDLAPFFPKCYNSTVIITSRNRDVGYLSNTHHLELGEMRAHEALSTLLRAARRQGALFPGELSDTHALTKTLSDLAVALVQAGTYCYQLSTSPHGVPQPFTFAQYIELFSLQRSELMKRIVSSFLDEYQLGAYTAFDISYQALPKLAKDFLHFVSLFDHSNISVSMLSKAAKGGFADPNTFIPRPEDQADVIGHPEALLCIDGWWDEKRVHEIIHTLRSFPLITASSFVDTVFLHLHPLVHTWARDTLPSDFQQHRKMALQVVTSCTFEEDVRLYRYILPHILDILGQIKLQDIHVNDLVWVGDILKSQGHYRKATGLVEAALEKLMHCEEQSAEKRLLIVTRLATLYWADGRWEEAEKLEVGILEQREKLQGMEHPDTITAAESRGSTYHSQSRWSEAEKLLMEVLKQRKKLLGMEHLDTIQAAANLAATYHSQGRWIEAETLQVEVLEGRKRVQGMKHLGTIRAAANLAGTYNSQGRWNEAEMLEVEVLEQQKKVLGMDHPDTIRAASNLASIYQSQGWWSEAKKLKLEALEQGKRVLGMEHPETILAAANLAFTYSKQGQLDEAANLLAPAVDLSVKVLGQQHPSAQSRIRGLARLYEKLGKQKEAQETKALLLS